MTNQLYGIIWAQYTLITQFEKPAFSIRVEESVRQIISIILRDFERLVPYALIQFLWVKFIEKRNMWENGETAWYQSFVPVLHLYFKKAYILYLMLKLERQIFILFMLWKVLSLVQDIVSMSVWCMITREDTVRPRDTPRRQ